jgi:hypothetical protein
VIKEVIDDPVIAMLERRHLEATSGILGVLGVFAVQMPFIGFY